MALTVSRSSHSAFTPRYWLSVVDRGAALVIRANAFYYSAGIFDE